VFHGGWSSCYLPEQIKDMQRFCTAAAPTVLRSVVGIDRTFNLGPCFVTTLVYKNMAVVRDKTQEHPIFLGPVMFHFDGKTETYIALFSHLLTALAADGVTTEFLGDGCTVFGSDEEKALVNAIRAVFTNSDHVYCARHISDNVSRHLSESGVDASDKRQVMNLLKRCTVVGPDTSVICDDAVRELLEHVSVHLPQTSDYFRQHVVPKLRHNMEVLGRHSWIRRGWNNNNAESYNHVLKSKIEWRTMKRMMDLIECVQYTLSSLCRRRTCVARCTEPVTSGCPALSYDIA